MSDFNRNKILIALKVGIEQEFTPRIIVESIEVDPDYKQRRWIIRVTGFIPELKEFIDFQQEFNSLV